MVSVWVVSHPGAPRILFSWGKPSFSGAWLHFLHSEKVVPPWLPGSLGGEMGMTDTGCTNSVLYYGWPVCHPES